MYFSTPDSRRVPHGSERALRFWRRRRFHRSSICRSEASKSSLDILVLNSLAELCVILYDVIRICSRQTVTMTCADTRAAAQLTRSKTCHTNDVQRNDKHGCIKIRATCNSVWNHGLTKQRQQVPIIPSTRWIYVYLQVEVWQCHGICHLHPYYHERCWLLKAWKWSIRLIIATVGRYLCKMWRCFQLCSVLIIDTHIGLPIFSFHIEHKLDTEPHGPLEKWHCVCVVARSCRTLT